VNLASFNKAKCKVLHMRWGHLWYQYKVGDEGIEGSPAEKDLGVLGYEKLGMSQHEQPDLFEDVPAHCRGVGLGDL